MDEGGAQIQEYVEGILGFRDGGGQIQHTRIRLQRLHQRMNLQR